MPLFPDISPLVEQVKQFNQHQREIIILLKEIKECLLQKKQYEQRSSNNWN